jgi:catechol 2,3-dioxygenase-like lactoylglutathione lyase family enzyme
MPEQALGTERVTQVGMIVRNIEATARAWSEILGQPMPEIHLTDPVELTQAEYKGQPTSARAKLAFFHLGQVDLELIEPVGGPSTWTDQLEQHGDSLHHIAFEVNGMPQRVAYLDSLGLPVVQRGEYSGGRYAYVDSGTQLGCILELLEND